MAVWFLFVYIVFTSQPIESEKYLSINMVMALRASVAMLYLMIWLAGVFAWSHVKHYADMLANSREGSAFQAIANSLLVLIVGTVAASLVGALRSHFAANPEIVIPTTIVLNYLYAISGLIGFWFMYIGTRKLYNLAPKRWLTRQNYIIGLLPVALLSIAYASLMFISPNRQMPAAYDIPATFYLSDAIIVFTLLIPTINGWILAVVSVMHVVVYIKNSTEPMYKAVLEKFAYGIVGILAGSMLVQILVSIGRARLSDVNVGFVISLIFIVIGLQFIGYGLIAYGARKLGAIQKPDLLQNTPELSASFAHPQDLKDK